MNGIFANYLWTMFWESVFGIFWIMWFFPWKYKYRCIRVYVWFKDDKHVIWMWIWLILKNISLLDRIWSLWLVCFDHSPPNFIFWLGRLIFSVSINSHPDNIYLSLLYKATFSYPILYLSFTRQQILRYGISVLQMTTDMFHLSQTLPGSFLIHDLSLGL